MRVVLISIFIFLACVLIGRKAQSNDQHVAIHTLSFAQPFIDLLRSQDHGLESLRNSMEEGNIQGVVTLLQNHIKQWSFIEAQLLEPNVNLGMPEIFIPLKHLTTTLQTLGGIFLMKNDLQEAKSCLERACPLMELLPSALDESYKLDNFAFANAYFEAGEDLSQNGHSRQGQESDGEFQGNYAANCFALLRSVYLRIYEKSKKDDVGIANKALPHVEDKPKPDVRIDETDYEDYDEDYNNNYYDEYSQDEDGADLSDSYDDPADSTANKSSKDDASGIDDMIEQLRQPFQHLRSEIMLVRNQDSSTQSPSSSKAKKNANQELRTSKDKYMKSNGLNGAKVDADKLRNILGSKSKKGMKEQWESSTPNSQHTVPVSGKPLENILFPSFLQRGNGNSDLSMHSAQTMSGIEEKDAFSGANAGSSTSIIAADLEVMLRKFVKEDGKGRGELLELARKYYADLDVIFPYMDYNEYAANMDLGVVYLEVMERVVNEGFDFIGPELEKWQDVGQALIVRSAKLSKPEVDPKDREGDGNGIGLGIVWELDPESGKKKEYTVELDGSYFDAFSLNERNRLLVLSAFDIAAHLEPTEHFDLSLGFSLGILDNDRSRQRVLEKGMDPDDTYSEKKKRAKPQGKQDKVVSASLFEEQTSPAISISSSLRSSVPTLNLENDWTFSIFIFFLFLTIVIMGVSYVTTSRRKAKTRTRPTKRSPYDQLGHALYRPIAVLLGGEIEECEESVWEAVGSIVKSWQVPSNCYWLLCIIYKAVVIDLSRSISIAIVALFTKEIENKSKKVIEKEKGKGKEIVATTSNSNTAPSPALPIEEQEKQKLTSEATAQRTGNDVRKTKGVEEKGRNRVEFELQIETSNSSKSTPSPPKSNLTTNFAEESVENEKEKVPGSILSKKEEKEEVKQKSENRSQSKANNPRNNKPPSTLPVVLARPSAPSSASIMSASSLSEDISAWYGDWQEGGRGNTDEGWMEAKKKTNKTKAEQKDGKKIQQPVNNGKSAYSTTTPAASTHSAPYAPATHPPAYSKPVIVKKPVKPALVPSKTVEETGKNRIPEKSWNRVSTQDVMPTSPSLDGVKGPSLSQSESVKGVTYKNIVANETSPSLSAMNEGMQNDFDSASWVSSMLPASLLSSESTLLSMSSNTEDSSSLLYRLGISSLNEGNSLSSLTAPPGLGNDPLYPSSRYAMSLPSDHDMERDMERDMESHNLLQGILGDILHPSSPGLDHSARTSSLYSTSLPHPPTSTFLYSSLTTGTRDSEGGLTAQSDLSPLAPVFDPTKGLVLEEEQSSTMWSWKH